MNRFLLIALLVTPATLQAATISYTNRALFESTLGALVVDDYENPSYVFNQLNATMSGILNETTYTSTAFTDWNLVILDTDNHYYCAGCNGSFRLDFTTTSISVSNGVDAVGFNFFNHPTNPFSAYVTFGDGSTTNYPLPTSFSLVTFFGIASDKEIATIHLGLANGVTTFAGGFGIDNLTIGRIPEPTSLMLFGVALASITLRRRVC